VKSIAVIGAGYVGITTAACFASMGHSVILADNDLSKLENLGKGICPIVEDGLTELILDGVEKNRLSFSSSNTSAVTNADFIFLCLPTPQGKDGTADTSYIQSVSKEIGPYLQLQSVVVTKSTVPVGSAAVIVDALGRQDVAVVSNPEFLREGSAIHDFMHPDRIVIGSNSIEASRLVSELYETLSAKVIITDPSSAETIKYAANAFLATKISFINAVAAICEGVGADVLDVIEGIGSDSRIGRAFLDPGPGWGGSCFPKDTKALVKIAERAGYDFALLRGVVEVNQQQQQRIVEKVLSLRHPSTEVFRVCALGLTFKAGTDDRRDSPAVSIIQLILDHGVEVYAYDPTVSMNNTDQDLAGISIRGSIQDAARSSDLILLLTEWPEFRSLEPQNLSGIMRSKNVVDARNIFDSSEWRSAGFTHIGVGR
jgi:UDPglucose 6-dehydrogenase